MISKRANLTPLLALTVVACAFAWPRAGEGASDTATSKPTTTPATPTSTDVPTPAVGPVAYYVASCARCHGDVSAAYVGLDHPKRGKALEKAVDDMAYGPAQAPLDAEGLKQQTALHEAMFGKTPFVWLDPAAKNITGEVGPDTTLTFEPATGPASTPAITDNRFDIPKQPGTLVARRGEAVLKTVIQ